MSDDASADALMDEYAAAVEAVRADPEAALRQSVRHGLDHLVDCVAVDGTEAERLRILGALREVLEDELAD